MNPEATHKSRKALWLGLVVLILVGGLGGGSLYFYFQYHQSQLEIEMLKNNPQEVTKIETQKIVNLVNKLMILPTNETPIDITVTDTEKLKGQAIFAEAQDGDRMLVYSQAKKAILYRPSVNKVVASFNNISLNNPAPTGGVIPTAAPAPNTSGAPTPISPLP